MNRKDLFKIELDYLKSDDLKKSLVKIIELLPEYWFSEAASSTGKYHPEYALGDGGLLRHSKAAMRIGYELLNDPTIGDKYNDHEKDLMLMALLVHDGLKRGINEEKYTRFDHPILMGDFIVDHCDEIGVNMADADFLKEVIKTHMGPWNVDYNGNEVLEKPQNKYQTFVHMCDYLASRKCLLVPFDSDNNIIV